MTVWGFPAADQHLVARDSTCAVNCMTGDRIVKILTSLQDQLGPKFKALDDHYTNGTNSTETIGEIAGLFNTAAVEINALPKDPTRQYNGKIIVIVNLCVSIIIDVVDHSPEQSDKTNSAIFQSLSGPALGLGNALSEVDDYYPDSSIKNARQVVSFERYTTYKSAAAESFSRRSLRFLADMLRLAIFHIFAIALAFSTIVWGVPITEGKNLVARGGTCLVGCNTGTQISGTLVGLRRDLEEKFKALDDCYISGANPTKVMNEMTVLFNNAGSKIRNLPIDMTGQLNGKGLDIINQWHGILTDLDQHFNKWGNKSNLSSRAIGDIFARLSAQAGTTVTATQSSLSDALESIQTSLSETFSAAGTQLLQVFQQLLQQALGQTLSAIEGVIGG
ncbi:hypothetical protein RSOLAG22IIIB_08013 [Rhizoctonia solani]|uniref:Uncharacterized protein n=1 Tax=Rhizoctonia solani TaxID=456999 RepID=A0A0K6FQT6_9AGAM|nr:hypothetical protein RSOLAG22IIIB_08013 [Rhizoctonia solani]